MTPLLKKLGYATVLAMMGVYAYLMITGPGGLSALRDRREQINLLQRQKADLLREKELRTERIRLLREDRETQLLEAEKRLRKKQAGSSVFYVEGESSSDSTEE